MHLAEKLLDESGGPLQSKSQPSEPCDKRQIHSQNTNKKNNKKTKCQENDKVEGDDDLSDLLHQLKSVDVAGSIVIKENRYSGK